MGGQRGLGDQEREEPRQEVEGTFLLGQLGASNLTAAGEAADGPRMRGRATRPFQRPSLRPGSTSARLHLRLASRPLMEGSRGCTHAAGALAPASLQGPGGAQHFREGTHVLSDGRASVCVKHRCSVPCLHLQNPQRLQKPQMFRSAFHDKI